MNEHVKKFTFRVSRRLIIKQLITNNYPLRFIEYSLAVLFYATISTANSEQRRATRKKNTSNKRVLLVLDANTQTALYTNYAAIKKGDYSIKKRNGRQFESFKYKEILNQLLVEIIACVHSTQHVAHICERIIMFTTITIISLVRHYKLFLFSSHFSLET